MKRILMRWGGKWRKGGKVEIIIMREYKQLLQKQNSLVRYCNDVLFTRLLDFLQYNIYADGWFQY